MGALYPCDIHTIQVLILCCIVLAGITVGIQTYPTMENNETLKAIDTVVLILFTIEVGDEGKSSGGRTRRSGAVLTKPTPMIYPSDRAQDMRAGSLARSLLHWPRLWLEFVRLHDRRGRIYLHLYRHRRFLGQLFAASAPPPPPQTAQQDKTDGDKFRSGCTKLIRSSDTRRTVPTPLSVEHNRARTSPRSQIGHIHFCADDDRILYVRGGSSPALQPERPCAF